jgi:curved DNA-binding protein CbpA
MAMQWHPDRCKEQNANEIFLRIQEAYSVLSDPNKRPRYDAGLALEASLGKQAQPVDLNALSQQYRSPLRCGLIMVECLEIVGRFKVSKILAWQDIYNDRGQTLVSSWAMGAAEPTKVWA